MTFTSSNEDRVYAAQERAARELLLDPFKARFDHGSTACRGFENIAAVGVGEKVTRGELTGCDAVIIYVVRKDSMDRVDPAVRVPSTYEGVLTDVVESGEFVAALERGHHRPPVLGVSTGHVSGTTGTLGFFARREGEDCIVGSSHVFACENEAHQGDRILQPAVVDGGSASDAVGFLWAWSRLDFSGNLNEVDAAAARVTEDTPCSQEIFGFGPIDPTPTVAYPRMRVLKCGRSSSITRGIVKTPSTYGAVRHGGRVAQMTNQIITKGVGRPFSEEGDSGAVVIEEVSRRPVGLICATSSRLSMLCPIEAVLSELGVSIQEWVT